MVKIHTPEGCVENKMGRIGNRPYWVLILSVGIRAVHQVGAALFLAPYLLPGTVAPLPPLYLAVAFASGVGLFYTEWLRHRQLGREVAGLVTLSKLVLLGAAFHGFSPASMTALSAFVLASIGAHAPKKFRHRLLY